MTAERFNKSKLPSRYVSVGPQSAPHRSYYYAMGMTEKEIAQPFVGVATTWNEAAPCNISLMRQAQAVKKGVKAAGGTPREFATITVTVKAVNHRFLDLQLRVPSSMAAAESRIRALVQSRVSRGRVEITVSVQQRRASAVEVELKFSATSSAWDYPSSPWSFLRGLLTDTFLVSGLTRPVLRTPSEERYPTSICGMSCLSITSSAA